MLFVPSIRHAAGTLYSKLMSYPQTLKLFAEVILLPGYCMVKWCTVYNPHTLYALIKKNEWCSSENVIPLNKNIPLFVISVKVVTGINILLCSTPKPVLFCGWDKKKKCNCRLQKSDAIQSKVLAVLRKTRPELKLLLSLSIYFLACEITPHHRVWNSKDFPFDLSDSVKQYFQLKSAVLGGERENIL